MSRIFSPSQWIAVISLFSLSTLVETPGQATTAGGAGPPPAGNHQPTSKQGKPGIPPPAQSPGKSGLRHVPREQTPPLEERLQRGQMDKAVAQGQVSDRLEQFHKASPDRAP